MHKKEFLRGGIHGEREIQVLDIDSQEKINKITLPILAHAIKGLDNGWVLLSGMNLDGMVTYNIYKEKFFSGVFKYSKATVHGIIYFKSRKLIVIAANEGYFTLYRMHEGRLTRRQTRLP